jgi:hypothetical protein
MEIATRMQIEQRFNSLLKVHRGINLQTITFPSKEKVNDD